MTATNHVLTGAVVAATVREPILAIPVALLSHYVLDALPHFGVSEDSEVRNRSKCFRCVLAADVCLFAAALIVVPIACQRLAPAWLLLACMLAAFLPDVPWIYRFFQELKAKAPRKRHILNHLHGKLQWGERPWGVAIEILWFGWAVTALNILR